MKRKRGNHNFKPGDKITIFLSESITGRVTENDNGILTIRAAGKRIICSKDFVNSWVNKV